MKSLTSTKINGPFFLSGLLCLIKLTLQNDTLKSLQTLLGGYFLDSLGFSLDLKAGTITDKLNSRSKQHENQKDIQIFATLLSHYAESNSVPLSGKLVKFKDLPGGYAYEGAFIQRAIEPVAEAFGEKPQELIIAAKQLGGNNLSLGDASVEIQALKGVPLTYILWITNEFPASANILYDESASKYLPTEDLAVLGELTTIRLIEAKSLTGHCKMKFQKEGKGNFCL
jgi:hypothetical protein